MVHFTHPFLCDHVGSDPQPSWAWAVMRLYWALPSPLESSYWAENAAFIMLFCSEAFSTAHSHNKFSVIWPAFRGPYKVSTAHFSIFTPYASSIIPPALTSPVHLQPPPCLAPPVSLAWMAHSPSLTQILPIFKGTVSPTLVSFLLNSEHLLHITC